MPISGNAPVGQLGFSFPARKQSKTLGPSSGRKPGNLWIPSASDKCRESCHLFTLLKIESTLRQYGVMEPTIPGKDKEMPQLFSKLPNSMRVLQKVHRKLELQDTFIFGANSSIHTVFLNTCICHEHFENSWISTQSLEATAFL